jgi:hypothetical protein
VELVEYICSYFFSINVTVYKVEKDGGSFRICFSMSLEHKTETHSNSFSCETILTLNGLERNYFTMFLSPLNKRT